MNLLINTDQFAPTYARYYETYVNVAKRQPPVGEITESTVTPPGIAIERLREIRSTKESEGSEV
jgi:hypothetical protein